MRCKNHPAIETEVWCNNCKQPICQRCDLAKSPDGHLCAICVALTAVTDYDKEADQQRESLDRVRETEEQRKEHGRRIMIAVVIAAMILVPWRLLSYFAGDPALANATPVSRKDTVDECIYRLLEASDIVQAGGVPASDIYCVGSDLPLLILDTGTDLTVQVQDPQNFGFRSMSVSRSNPIPVLLN